MLVVGQSGAHRASLSAGINPMTSRYVPYATTPTRLLGAADQRRGGDRLDIHLGAGRDGGALRRVDHRRVWQASRRRGQRVAGNLDSAGDSADDVPLDRRRIEQAVAAAGEAALRHRGRRRTTSTARPAGWHGCWRWPSPRHRSWRSRCRGCSCGSGSSGASGPPSRWLRQPRGEQLLALRALANRPLAKLAAITADPVGAWRNLRPHRDPRPGRPGAPRLGRTPPLTSVPIDPAVRLQSYVAFRKHKVAIDTDAVAIGGTARNQGAPACGDQQILQRPRRQHDRAARLEGPAITWRT